MIIGIIGAMEKEITLLKEAISNFRIEKRSILEFYIGELEGKEVVLVKSGIGKVNAAMCTQILIDIYDVDIIINTGVAGALHPSLDVGDIVVSTEAMQHDMDASIFGHPKGLIPDMETSIFKANKKMLDIIDDIKEDFPVNIFKGRILSGDQGIGDLKIKNELFKSFEGYCVEMEGAAIAQVSYLNDKPFLIIRSISDNADHDVEVNYYQFVKTAAKNSSDMLRKLIANI